MIAILDDHLEDREVEVSPPQNLILNIVVKKIVKHFAGVSVFAVSEDYSYGIMNATHQTLQYPHDITMGRDEALEMAITALPYFNQKFPSGVKSPHDLIVSANYVRDVELSSKPGFPEVCA